MKRYTPTGRRNYGRPLKRLLDTWEQNGSTSGPTPWQIDDDDEESQKCFNSAYIHLILSYNSVVVVNTEITAPYDVDFIISEEPADTISRVDKVLHLH
jgi:hypothetical protein